jgi:hypothetical protein
MATLVMSPTTGPSSARAISASELAVSPHAGRHDDEVVHGAAEHHAHQDPQVAGQEAELRGQHRADQRAPRR